MNFNISKTFRLNFVFPMDSLLYLCRNHIILIIMSKISKKKKISLSVSYVHRMLADKLYITYLK